MSFTLDMSKFAKKANDNIDILVKRTVAGVANEVIERSPVGDASYWINPAPKGYVGGRFRGNWDYGFNAAPTSEYSTIDANGSVSLARIESGMIGKPAAGMHYIANNLPYAQRIEEGWSRNQAPHGVVALTVIKFQAIVDEAARAIA